MLVRRVFGIVDDAYEQLVHRSDTETAVTAAIAEDPPATPLMVEFAPREYWCLHFALVVLPPAHSASSPLTHPHPPTNQLTLA